MQNMFLEDVYDGNEPYAFISYSHKDDSAMKKVKQVLMSYKIRYWYDNGLHSGDDWNLVIAKHLQSATVCLLLLSHNSADSEYVKNELNFAMNHRVPIHTLLLEDFVLPPDIEMMTGRRQMIGLGQGFDEKLIRALPIELLSTKVNKTDNDIPVHPVFAIDELLFERQGTKTYAGHHLRLGYKYIVQFDEVSSIEIDTIQECMVNASRINHPVFPKIIDYLINNNQVWTFLENRNEQFLDRYLQQNNLDQTVIFDWFHSIVDAMEVLFKNNFTLRDLSRGSVTVISGKKIGISRLQNSYYGIYKISQETKDYYFDIILQELSILLAQLCLGDYPLIPIRMINVSKYGRGFLDKVNLIIQKCTRVNGKTTYSSFAQIKDDIKKTKLSRSEKVFLRERAKRLLAYEKEHIDCWKRCIFGM